MILKDKEFHKPGAAAENLREARTVIDLVTTTNGDSLILGCTEIYIVSPVHNVLIRFKSIQILEDKHAPFKHILYFTGGQ